jgi:hypothetical protein
MYMRGMGRFPRVRALRGVRRGFGQLPSSGEPTDTSVTTLNYPGMPIDLGSMIATPLTPSQIAALSVANAQYFGSQQGLGPFAPQPGTAGTISATQWINQNAVTVMIGAAIFLIAFKAVSK